MTHSDEVFLDGKSLKVESIQLLVANDKVKVRVSENVLKLVEENYAKAGLLMSKQVIYGLNTGFGPMADILLPRDKQQELQKNLVLSHACGAGKRVDSSFVLAAMVTRLNTLLNGASAVSGKLVKLLVDMINNRIIPFVYEHGAVGTSGDLVQLAHIALAVIGEGMVEFGGNEMTSKEAFRKAGLVPRTLEGREGLALINGTAFMAGVASVVLGGVEKVYQLALDNAALALQVSRTYTDCIDDRLHAVRPHKGQVQVAKALRLKVDGNSLMRERSLETAELPDQDTLKLSEAVQQVYSLRCVPQILGPFRDTLDQAFATTELELNSVTDNPVYDAQNSEFLHGGNFHGEVVGVMCDQLKIPLAKLTMLAERRVNFFLNSKLNGFLPPFLNLQTPGLDLALQGLQFVATSTTARVQSLSFPQSVHSIPTNADNQDIVSMGTDSALILNDMLEMSFIVQTIESVALAQTVDVLDVESKLSEDSKKHYSRIRQVMPSVKKDRYLSEELNKLVQLLKN